jgi:thioredoxin reductase
MVRLQRCCLRPGSSTSSPTLPGSNPSTGFPYINYCDGFEYAGKPVAAYGKGDKAQSWPS